MSILFKELAQAYGSLALAQPCQLASLPLRYADFSCWQQEQSTDGAWLDHIEYWKNKLHGREPLLELPTDRLRPPVQSHRGSTVGFTVDEVLASQIGKLYA